MLVGDVEDPRDAGSDEQADPSGVDRLLARLGLLGEAGPELGAAEASGQRDLDPRF